MLDLHLLGFLECNAIASLELRSSELLIVIVIVIIVWDRATRSWSARYGVSDDWQKGQIVQRLSRPREGRTADCDVIAVHVHGIHARGSLRNPAPTILFLLGGTFAFGVKTTFRNALSMGRLDIVNDRFRVLDRLLIDDHWCDARAERIWRTGREHPPEF